MDKNKCPKLRRLKEFWKKSMKKHGVTRMLSFAFFWQIVAYDIFLHMFAFGSSGFFRLLEYGNL